MGGFVRVLKVLGKWGAAIVALPMIYFCLAFLGAVVPGNNQLIDDVPEVEIALVAGPIHNDFLLPLTEETRAKFGFVESDGLPVNHDQAGWLLVGWGAREFYTSVGSYRDVTFGATMKALFGDRSVMRVEVVGAVDPEGRFPVLQLSKQQYAALLDAIVASFDGSISLSRASDKPGAVFYPAKGGFHIGRTCNQWVGEMLRRAGVRFGVWTPVPAAIRLSLWWFHSA